MRFSEISETRILGESQTRFPDKEILCPMSEIVYFPVLIFTYSHVENSLFFRVTLQVIGK